MNDLSLRRHRHAALGRDPARPVGQVCLTTKVERMSLFLARLALIRRRNDQLGTQPVCPSHPRIRCRSVAVTWRGGRVASVLRQTAQKEMLRHRQTRKRGDFGFDFGSRAPLTQILEHAKARSSIVY